MTEVKDGPVNFEAFYLAVHNKLLPPHCADRVTLQADGAGLRATQPRERQQGERLAAAVAAQDGDEFATQKAQREALDEHPSGHADAEPG